jgi:hypothetical protein
LPRRLVLDLECSPVHHESRRLTYPLPSLNPCTPSLISRDVGTLEIAAPMSKWINVSITMGVNQIVSEISLGRGTPAPASGTRHGCVPSFSMKFFPISYIPIIYINRPDSSLRICFLFLLIINLLFTQAIKDLRSTLSLNQLPLLLQDQSFFNFQLSPSTFLHNKQTNQHHQDDVHHCRHFHCRFGCPRLCRPHQAWRHCQHHPP